MLVIKTVVLRDAAILEGNDATHGGDPLTDARLYVENIGTDDQTWTILYGIPVHRIYRYSKFASLMFYSGRMLDLRG